MEIQEKEFDASFLRVLQLIAHGVIESNPGPFTVTPKNNKVKNKVLSAEIRCK